MRIFRLVRFTFIACSLAALASCASGPDPRAFYESSNAVLAVSSDNSVTLTSTVDQRDVQIKVFYPHEGGPYPLIVLSHGTFSSIDKYDRIAAYWAEHGYVVMLPQHVDANYGVVPTGYEVMQNVARSRVADMSMVLDELEAIETQLPALVGKIEHGSYVAAGHSMGTQVAMLVTGLRYQSSFEAQIMESGEDRYEQLILVSDPGKMRLMPDDLWIGSSVPTFMATGTDDYGLMGQRGEPTEVQSELMSDPAEVDRYLLLLQGGDHYFGGLVQKDRDTPPDYEGLGIFNNLSLAFLDAYAKHQRGAKTYLAGVELQQISNQRASLEKRLH